VLGQERQLAGRQLRQELPGVVGLLPRDRQVGNSQSVKPTSGQR
jgi:hypothetical protein